MRDMLGNELAKGDLVAYGARSGNTGELRVAIVVNPAKAQILSGTGGHQTWDWQNKKQIDRYYFEVGSSLGTGVHGSRLMKLNPKDFTDIYDKLKEKARKWLDETE